MLKNTNEVNVSVIVPFYKGRDWLIEALDSVLQQSHKCYEVIVVDDGSVENIQDLWFFELPNFFLYSQNNLGAAEARNRGIREACGEFLCFLDSDDIWPNNKLEAQLNYMSRTGANWSQHSYYKFKSNGEKDLVDTSKHQGNVTSQLFTSFRVQTSTVMVRRDFIDEHQVKFPSEFKHGQDSQFYLQLSLVTDLHFVENVIGGFRMHGTNVGFNPKVQLISKFMMWDKWHNESKVIEVVPFLAKIAHIYCFLFVKIFHKGKIAKNYNRMTWFYYPIYMIPYLLLRISAKFKNR